MKRIQQRQEVKQWRAYDFNGTVASLVTELQELQADHPGVALHLDGDYYSDYGDSERSFSLTAYYMREETDAEFAARKEQQDTWKENRRKQFEALKKEFGEG